VHITFVAALDRLGLGLFPCTNFPLSTPRWASVISFGVQGIISFTRSHTQTGESPSIFPFACLHVFVWVVEEKCPIVTIAYMFTALYAL